MRLLTGVVLVDVPALLDEVPGPLRVVGPQVLLGDVFAFPLVWRGEVVEVAFRWAKGAGVDIPQPPPGIWYPGITDWLASVAAVTGGRVVLVDDAWHELSVDDAAGMLADLETSDDYGPDDVPATDHTDAQPLTEDGPADREQAMAEAFEGLHQSVELHAAQLYGGALATRRIVAYLRAQAAEAPGRGAPIVLSEVADRVEAGEHRLGDEE
jgi:hypothetical protein